MSKFSRREIIGGAVAGTIAAGAGAGTAEAASARIRADVCVVGAGFAGLAAAYRLKQAGANVVRAGGAQARRRPLLVGADEGRHLRRFRRAMGRLDAGALLRADQGDGRRRPIRRPVAAW